MNGTIFRPLLLLCALLLLPVLSVQAQLDGSGYSRYGIGDLLYFPNSRAAAMGGVTTAMLPVSTIDAVNPANWTRVSLTRFAVSGMFRSISTEDLNASGKFGSTMFNGLALAVPVAPSRGIVAALTVAPYSTTGYTVLSSRSQGGFTYDLNYHGEGGLSRAQIGLSWNAGAAVNVGLSYNYYFGSIEHNITQTITSGSFANASSIREVQLKGSGFTVGAVYAGLGNFISLPERSAIHLGAFASTTSYLSADEERRLTSTSGGNATLDTLTFRTYNLKLPFRLGIGLAYTADRFAAGTDIVMQNWDESRYPGVLLPTVRSSYRWSAGGEFTPRREGSAPFFQRLTYRLGTYYDATYFVINGQPVNEYGFTGGVGLPIFGDTRLDITGEYGMRGSTDFGLQKDNLLRLSFTLTGGEPWFVQPPED